MDRAQPHSPRRYRLHSAEQNLFLKDKHKNSAKDTQKKVSKLLVSIGISNNNIDSTSELDPHHRIRPFINQYSPMHPQHSSGAVFHFRQWCAAVASETTSPALAEVALERIICTWMAPVVASAEGSVASQGAVPFEWLTAFISAKKSTLPGAGDDVEEIPSAGVPIFLAFHTLVGSIPGIRGWTATRVVSLLLMFQSQRLVVLGNMEGSRHNQIHFDDLALAVVCAMATFTADPGHYLKRILHVAGKQIASTLRLWNPRLESPEGEAHETLISSPLDVWVDGCLDSRVDCLQRSIPQPFSSAPPLTPGPVTPPAAVPSLSVYSPLGLAHTSAVETTSVPADLTPLKRRLSSSHDVVVMEWEAEEFAPPKLDPSTPQLSPFIAPGSPPPWSVEELTRSTAAYCDGGAAGVERQRDIAAAYACASQRIIPSMLSLVLFRFDEIIDRVLELSVHRLAEKGIELSNVDDAGLNILDAAVELYPCFGPDLDMLLPPHEPGTSRAVDSGLIHFSSISSEVLIHFAVDLESVRRQLVDLSVWGARAHDLESTERDMYSNSVSFYKSSTRNTGGRRRASFRSASTVESENGAELPGVLSGRSGRATQRTPSTRRENFSPAPAVASLAVSTADATAGHTKKQPTAPPLSPSPLDPALVSAGAESSLLQDSKENPPKSSSAAVPPAEKYLVSRTPSTAKHTKNTASRSSPTPVKLVLASVEDAPVGGQPFDRPPQSDESALAERDVVGTRTGCTCVVM